MINRIFGLETEYGLLVNQDRPEHSPSWIANRLRDHIFHIQQRGILDRHHRGHDEPPGNGGFLLNAGRIYLDMGHLEYASPECGTLADLIASDRAGDVILQEALAEMGLVDDVSIVKNNIDHQTDVTFGSHENYLVSRKFPFTLQGLGQLVPFLITRQVFTGAGRVGMADVPNGLIVLGEVTTGRRLVKRQDRGSIPYQLSQRADHIMNEFFEWVQQNRALVNTRDEPLADPSRFRRIHLLLGDSNMSEVATALKIGTTSLVLQLIEDGRAPEDLDVEDPVETLRAISRDQSRSWQVTLETGKTLSALDVQEQYLDAAQRHYRGQDDETDWILHEWESVLADLRRDDYTALVGRVDWASKLWLLETFRESEGLDWDDPWLQSLDLEYHNLNPDKGLFFALQQEGRAPRMTTDKAVALAQKHPPRNTRAFGRGEVVRHLLETPMLDPPVTDYRQRVFPPYVINWSVLQLRGQAPFPMPNPFQTYVDDVRAMLKNRLSP